VRHEILKVSRAATKMAQGDLDVTLPVVTENEIGQVTTALDQFRLSIIEAQERETAMREKQKAEEAQQRDLEKQEQKAKEQDAEEERRVLARQRAHERAVTAEISAVVTACAAGDFSQRLDLAGKEGMFAELCKGINKIAEVTETNIDDLVRSINELSNGNLGVRIDGEREGAFQRMKEDFNEALKTLSHTMMLVMQSGQTVSATSSDLEASSHDMAKRSEENAAAVEETSSAVEEVSASIRQVVTNARAATEATQKVLQSAVKTREASDATEASITAMTEASVQINTVVKVIEDIAFQINLLALNAGVEAARAGEAGRGFSVVASEVRALAQRSQEAVQEIGNVIEQNNRSVETGVEKVSLSREALEGIVSEVEVASEQITEITTSVEQQALSIDEVNSAIQSIDQTTQTNASALKEMIASSVSLNEDAEALSGALSQFQGVTIEKSARRRQSLSRAAPQSVPVPAVAAAGSAAIKDDWQDF